MLDMLEKKLVELKAFDGNIPDIVKAVADSIPSNNIPYRMKLAFAVSEIMLFISQFRINIKHWNGSSIPINAITFAIAKSGASKDSSIKAARKCFTKGYDIIEKFRLDRAKMLAIDEATANGEDDPEKWRCYNQYYIAPNPLFVAPSTVEGFLQHLNDLDTHGIGAGYIFSGEVGAELANSTVLVENIKILAELYDEGTKEVKVLKDRTNQSKEIKGLPVSALFMGSQDNILFDDNIKRRFKTEFNTKLARRSFFIFANEDIEQEEYNTIEAVLKYEKELEDTAINNRDNVSVYIEEITTSLLKTLNSDIEVSEEVRELFIIYKKYNEELAKTIDNSLSMTKLTRTHLQWKALKLAGALSVIMRESYITLDAYKAAIEFVELINKDILSFERELVKEPYEVFADYVKQNLINTDEVFVSLHTLRKMGYIPMKGSNPTMKIKELEQLVTSYDNAGIYEAKKDGILYKHLNKTNTIKVSYVPVSGNKTQRAKQCAKGYICEEVSFTDLEELLEGDYAYTPFKFTQGIRGRDNIESSCKWVVLDVDNSNITDKEVHLMLSDIRHYVVRTSNKNNEFKFRVLIELDSEVDVPYDQWSYFIESISEELSIDCDKLPKSQIFFSYKDREILSCLEAKPLTAKPHVVYAIDKANQKLLKEEKTTLTKTQKNALLDNPIVTFAKAFNAVKGEGSRKLIWAARRAKELGADKEYVLDLLWRINDYWENSMSQDKLEREVLCQIRRWTF